MFKESKKIINTNSTGRLNWKSTIAKSKKYIVNDELEMFPFFYNNEIINTNFITECMVLAINHTISKFNLFLNFEFIEYDSNAIQLQHSGEILRKLEHIRSYMFKDIQIKLIDDLIAFYSRVNEGGNYYFKHYSFSSVWEDMIEVYLSLYYAGVRDGHLWFDKQYSKKLHFQKANYFPNIANDKQFVSIDHYSRDGDTQLIFDAKYYASINGLNYKQLAYAFLLKEIRNNKEQDKPNYKNTLTALILPYERRISKNHFVMNPLFSENYKDLVITEEYIDIKSVIEEYKEYYNIK